MPRGTRDRALILKMVQASADARRRPLAERFWAKVRKDPGDGCWHWTGEKDTREAWPYGRIFIRDDLDKPVGRRHVRMMAHRCSWEIIHGKGPVPEGLTLHHTCKNTLCVRPDHLQIATFHENFVQFSDSPHGRNWRKTHCSTCNNPLSGANLAMVPGSRTRGKVTIARQCLTCYPHHWRYATIPRPRPPGSIYKPTDPDYDQRPSRKPLQRVV